MRRFVDRDAATRAKTARFFGELKRHKVFRAAAGYAVGSWVIIQLSAIMVPALQLPARVVLYVVIAVIVGFAFVVAVTWRASDVAGEPAGGASSGAGGGGRHHSERAVAAVAVLPFESLTPSTAHAYLAETIPLELQSLLSRVHDLRVVSRQSSVARSADKPDLPALARTLNVQYVISGSIADLGDRLQVNVQLDDAQDDTLLWAERYVIPAAEVERLQRELTEKIVEIFGGERLRAEIRRANDASQADAEAWQLVQRARAYLLDYTPASIAEAIPLLRHAVERDPSYAVAYATLGLVTAEQTLNGLSVDAAAARASAVENVRKAERLAPRDAVVLRAAGCVYAYIGDYRQSIELLRRAVKLAPHDLGTWGYLGWPLVATGEAADLAEVQEIMDRLLASSPQHPGRGYWLFHKSVAYVCADDCERALPLAVDYTNEQPRSSLGWLHYANVLGRLGRTTAARGALEQSIAVNPLMSAAYYADLMAVLTDRPAVIARRTDGIYAAGLLERHQPA